MPLYLDTPPSPYPFFLPLILKVSPFTAPVH